MNPSASQDRITPKNTPKHALGDPRYNNSHQYQQSSSGGAGMINDHMHAPQYNKRPRPSNLSPKTEDLVRKKNESEQKFRSLMDSIQMVDDSHHTGTSAKFVTSKSVDTKSVTPSSCSGGKSSKQQKKSKTRHKSERKHSRRESRASGDGSERIRGGTNRSGRHDGAAGVSSSSRPDDVADGANNSSRSGRHKSHRRRLRSVEGESPRGKSDPSGKERWAIKSVVSDNMESWMEFDQSESDFSESNADSVASFSEDPHADLLMQTPSSLLDRPGLAASINSPASCNISGIQQLRGLQPHPSLQHLVVMDSGRSRTSTSRASSHRRRKRSSSQQQQPPPPQSPGGINDNKGPLTKRDSTVSYYSNESLNPTPSVIAAGVEELAANFEIDVSPASSRDKEGAKFLNDDDSNEIRRKAARSANRRSKTQRRTRRTVTPEGIELDLEDEETMSTISHDPVLDYMAASKAREGSAVTNEVTQVQNVLSVQERQGLLAEVAKLAKEAQLAERERSERDRDRKDSSRSLADVLEDSHEGENTDNETPSRTTTNTPLSLSQSRGTTSGAASREFLTTSEMTKGVLNRSIDLNNHDLERDAAIVIGTPVEPYNIRHGCKEGASKIARNPNYVAGGVIFMIIVIVVVSVVLALRPTSTDSDMDAPSPAPTYTDSEIYDIIAAASLTEVSALRNINTPQGKAFAWVEGSTKNSVRSDLNRILQRYALGTLFFATGGEDWRDKEGWMTFEDECTWFASVDTPCDKKGNYVRLDLSSNKLHGEMPEDVGLLTNLVAIDLPRNALFGSIPSSLQNLSALTSLNLDANDYSRKIPSSVTSLTNLRNLSMNLNRFTGELPTEIGNLRNLEILSLAANRLTAGLPADIAEMQELKELNLEFNELSGPIRSELGLLRNLEYIKLDVNLFSLRIPTEIGLLVNLKSFTCNECSLFGMIPTEIGFLGMLETIELEFNQLTGTLPDEFGGATSLRRVDLSANGIEGSLPTTLGQLRNIKSFDMSANKLTGEVPKELSKIRSEHFIFYLNSNQITGSVPAEVCDLLDTHESVLSIDVGEVLPCACLECHTPANERKSTSISGLEQEPGNLR